MEKKMINKNKSDEFGTCAEKCSLGSANAKQCGACPYEEVKAVEKALKGSENFVKTRLKQLHYRGSKGNLANALNYLEHKCMECKWTEALKG